MGTTRGDAASCSDSSAVQRQYTIPHFDNPSVDIDVVLHQLFLFVSSEIHLKNHFLNLGLLIDIQTLTLIQFQF